MSLDFAARRRFDDRQICGTRDLRGVGPRRSWGFGEPRRRILPARRLWRRCGRSRSAGRNRIRVFRCYGGARRGSALSLRMRRRRGDLRRRRGRGCSPPRFDRSRLRRSRRSDRRGCAIRIMRNRNGATRSRNCRGGGGRCGWRRRRSSRRRRRRLARRHADRAGRWYRRSGDGGARRGARVVRRISSGHGRRADDRRFALRSCRRDRLGGSVGADRCSIRWPCGRRGRGGRRRLFGRHMLRSRARSRR